jgi:hypothetical protein
MRGVIPRLRQPGIRVAGDSESAVQLTSSGAPTIHMNGSQPVLKTKGRIHQSMGTFELA